MKGKRKFESDRISFFCNIDYNYMDFRYNYFQSC